jgi:hypothetical protein
MYIYDIISLWLSMLFSVKTLQVLNADDHVIRDRISFGFSYNNCAALLWLMVIHMQWLCAPNQGIYWTIQPYCSDSVVVLWILKSCVSQL